MKVFTSKGLSVGLIILIVSVLFVSACKKNKSISGYVRDYYTGVPIQRVYMSFDVASGSGFGSSVAKHKYHAATDDNGFFILDDVGDDIDNAFYPNFQRSFDFDSTDVLWNYYIDGAIDDSLWLDVGRNTNLRLRPAAETHFIHPKKNDPNSIHDTILISAYHQSDMLTAEKLRSVGFQLLPSTMHTIEITYIHNGVQTKRTMESYISVAYQGDLSFLSRKKYTVNIPE